MPLTRRDFALTGAAVFALPAARAQAGGQPLKIIVPLPPGSGGDAVARILSPRLSALLAQPVVIENKPGGDMNVGTAYAAKAPADGTHLFMGHTSPMVLNPLVYPHPGYDAVRDFAPIGKISESSAVLVVNPSVPVQTLAEFVDYARQNAGRVSYGTAMLMIQASAEQLVYTRRLQMTRVPYKGGAQVMQDTVAGHLQMSMADTASYLQLIRAGKLRALATTGTTRNPLLPEVPTVREAGFPELQVSGWWGLYAPAKTPRNVQARVGSALQRVLAEREVMEQLRAIGAEAKPLPGEQLRQQMASESEHWASVFKTLKIKPGE